MSSNEKIEKRLPLYQADGFSPTERFIEFSEVRKYIPLSQSRYYALMREKRVPVSVKISDHRACFLLSEVLAYTEARIKERNKKIV
ncbi:MAG: AlpA family phage regulatory protein [Alphaproteobacteria bacterium]